jgi:hypothetical protein
MYKIIFLLLRAGFLTAGRQPSGMSLHAGARQPSGTAVRKTFLSAGRQE